MLHKARTAQTALETLYVNEQSYASATDQTELAKIEPSLADGPALTIPTHGTSTWKVSVISVGGQTFTIEKKVDATTGAPTVERKCTPVGKGGCPSTGNW
jgi:hypothetical protein